MTWPPCQHLLSQLSVFYISTLILNNYTLCNLKIPAPPYFWSEGTSFEGNVPFFKINLVQQNPRKIIKRHYRVQAPGSTTCVE